MGDTLTGILEILAASAAGFMAGGPIGAIGVGALTFLLAMGHNQTDAQGNPIPDSGLPWWVWALLGVLVIFLLGLIGIELKELL